MKQNIIKNPFIIVLFCLCLNLLFGFLIVDNISIWLNLSFHKGSEIEYITIVSGVILAPILEEVLFRLGLGNSKSTIVFLFSPILISFFVFYGYFKDFLFIPFLVFSYAVFLFVKNIKNLELIYENNKIFWWVINALIFSLCHIFYLDGEVISLYQKVLFLFIAYIPISICTIYLRVSFNFGIFYAILLHSLTNLCTLILNYILYH